MTEESNLEIFLYISSDEYQIFVFDKKKLINLYNYKTKINNEINFKDLNYLSKFLDEHIYKIEKLIGGFIKNVILIIDNDESLDVDISIKKICNESSDNHQYLKNNLIEIKDLFKDNYQDQTIMHMIVDNYIVSGKKSSKLIITKNDNYFCIEVNFISISNNYISIFEKMLEKYHIKVVQYMSGRYIKNFFNEESINLSLLAHKLKNGFNESEIIIVPRNKRNMGFFEKFFQLFG